MSEENNNFELSDDFSQWPESYWDWFGLDFQNATYNDLRRVYSKLIKRFRPETHPEHFQRIQNAFETLRGLIQSGAMSGDGNTVPHLTPTASDKDEDKVAQRRKKIQKEFLDTLFDKYIDKADWNGATCFLDQIVAIDDNTSEECQQKQSDLGELPYLYRFWLKYVLEPLTPDNSIDFIRYLVMGDKVSQQENELSICMKTLFSWLERAEFTHDNTVYEYLKEKVPTPLLNVVLNIKWINLLFEEDTNDIKIIHDDLESVKHRVVPDDTKAWVNLNIEAVEHLVWNSNQEAKEAIQDYMEQISNYPEHQELFEEKLDNLDQLMELVSSTKAIPQILPVNVHQINLLLLLSGNVAFTRSRRLIIRAVAALSDDVLRAFLVFDYLQKNHPLVVQRLVTPLQQLFLSRHPEFDEISDDEIDQITEKLMSFGTSVDKQQYHSNRLRILKFLLQNNYDPSKIVEYSIDKYLSMRDDRDKQQESEKLDKWLSVFVEDYALRLTYYAVMCCELDGMEEMD